MDTIQNRVGTGFVKFLKDSTSLFKTITLKNSAKIEKSFL